jgi:20S proteasome alpha/beta subunit
MSVTAIPKLPYRPTKPYIQPHREAKAMTIVVGLKCQDGVVLCADQQITASGAFKFNECKIHTESMGHTSIVFAYSGLPSLDKEVREKMMRKLDETGISEDYVYQAADEVLTEMGRNYSDMPLQMLIGTTGNPAEVFNEPTLLKFDGRGLHKADSYCLLGVGESALVRFFVEKLYYSWMPIQEAVNLAVYLVSKAEQYIDGCGGPINVSWMECLSLSCQTLPEKDIQNRINLMEKREAIFKKLIIEKPSS